MSCETKKGKSDEPRIIVSVDGKHPSAFQEVKETHIGGHRYAMRVWQEDSFRDLKRGGWQCQTSYLTSPQRMERLVLVLAVAITRGSFVLNADAENWKEVLDAKHSKYSIFRISLRFFKRMSQFQIQSIDVGLFFAPIYKLRP